ncbi:hypothetical protein Gasu2_33620 [Galdieria sulphuraria]|nr:hypothetical protein Gasu2_33620 [Galdieria sulphuraria]
MLPYKFYCVAIPERKKRAEERLSRIQVPFEMIEAVRWNSPLVRWYFENQKPTKFERESSLKEVACYLSHLKAYRRFHEEFDHVKTAVICEDDVVFLKNREALHRRLAEAVDELSTNRRRRIFLGYVNFHLQKELSHEFVNVHYQRIYGTQMYIISKEQCRETLKKYDRPLRYLIGDSFTSESFLHFDNGFFFFRN